MHETGSPRFQHTGEAALALMGTWSEGTLPGLFAQCTCTRTLSNWNFKDLSANGKLWFSPVAQTLDPNRAFVSHWFTTAFKPNERGAAYKGYIVVVVIWMVPPHVLCFSIGGFCVVLCDG
jgi:hypothetical protein